MLNNDQRARLAGEARSTYNVAPMSLDVNGAHHDWLAVVDYLWAEFDRMTTPRPRHDDDLAGLAARENASTPEPLRFTASTLRPAATLLRAQIGRDAENPYWAEGHPNLLDGARQYLDSLLDHLGPDVTGGDRHSYSTPDAARIATLEGTVSGLRAELAATLRRLDELRADPRLTLPQGVEFALLSDLEDMTGQRDDLKRTGANLVTQERQARADRATWMDRALSAERERNHAQVALEREQDAHAAVMRDLEVAREAAEQYRRDATDSALRLGRIRKALDD